MQTQRRIDHDNYLDLSPLARPDPETNRYLARIALVVDAGLSKSDADNIITAAADAGVRDGQTLVDFALMEAAVKGKISS